MFIIHNVEWIIRNAQIFKAAVHMFGLFVAISVWNLQLQLFTELFSLRGLCGGMAP